MKSNTKTKNTKTNKMMGAVKNSVLVFAWLALNSHPSLASSQTNAPHSSGKTATAEQTQQWLAQLDQKSGSIEFQAKGHPSALRIVGKGTGPQGSFAIAKQSVTGSASFDLTSLDTGISLRDKHMKEKYLQVDKYPNAKLSITQMNLPVAPSGGKVSAENVPFQGTLNLHGTEKPVTGTAKVDLDSQKVKIAANFDLNMADYGIEVPSFAGITIDNAVSVTIQSEGNVSAPL
jgi:polyisoprenoid-binding protein YceI